MYVEFLHIINCLFQGHEYNNPAKKPQIFLKPCFEDIKPKSSA